MSPRDSITAAVRNAAARGSPALVAFLTAGHPRRERFRQDLTAIAAAADVVEIGVPFTDPMADGVTIQHSSHVALSQHVSLRWILDELTQMPAVRAPLLLMSYLNPLLSFGLDELAEASVRARVGGFIVPDLPYDESDELSAVLDRHNLALVQMVTPVTAAARLVTICASSQGFVYAVTMTGTTGRNVATPADLAAYLGAVRAVARVPVCAGFGIRSREQVVQLAGHVDGVVVGSALVERLEKGEDPAAFLQSLRGEPQPA
jgi:tryptophan synthase alpha chain